MKKLTVENMIIDYLDAWRYDSERFQLGLTSTFGETLDIVVSSFVSMYKRGYISKRKFSKWDEITNLLELSLSRQFATINGKIAYKFNEDTEHFEKAC